MKEFFLPTKFTPESEAMIDRINTVLETYVSQGYDLSLRQLYYQLVAANIVVNSERSYKNIGNLVSSARLAGLIDWDIIKDRGREMTRNSHWDSPVDILNTAAASFQIDKWEEQPNYVELMVEKQALEGVLEPVCKELDIPFTANKGYSSSSAMYEAGQRMKAKLEDEREVHVIYLGDHDPSGIDMTRDIEEHLNLFASASDLGKEVIVHRIALNMPQISKLRPPENPAKLTDSRAEGYVAKFGRSSWELDAIEPRALATLVRNAVIPLRDEENWARAVKREEKMKSELRNFAKNSKFA